MLEKILQIKYTNNDTININVCDSEILDKQLDKFIKVINKCVYGTTLLPVHYYFYMTDTYYVSSSNIEMIALLENKPIEISADIGIEKSAEISKPKKSVSKKKTNK